MRSTNARAPVVWTRQEIAERILQGENLVIYRGQLLRVPHSWLQAHPGGGLAILHFVGRDATDEIDAFHAEPTLQKKVLNYVIGKVELEKGGIWQPLTPPVATGWGWVRQEGKDGKQGRWVREASVRTHEDDPSLSTSEILLVAPEKTSLSQSQPYSQETTPSIQTLIPPPSSLSLEEQTEYSKAFSDLHQRISDAGLYETPYWTGYGPEVLRYLTLITIAAVTYAYGWYMTSAVFIGLIWHQLSFLAHDLGHMGVTHSWVLDRILGIFIADFCGGLSIGWWVGGSAFSSVIYCLSLSKGRQP